LTIDEVIEFDDDIEYKLRLPNKEVKISFNKHILHTILQDKSNENRRAIRKALREGKLEDFENALRTIFSSIPHANFRRNDIQYFEGFYATVVYVYLQSLGIEIIGEDVSNKGNMDLTVFIEDKIYIIEFKITNEDALKYIKQNKYYEKYEHIKDKELYLVGMNFDVEEKNISRFVWEKWEVM
jgi:hypothetical protein